MEQIQYRDIVLVSDPYSESQAKERFPDKEVLMTPGAEKVKKNLLKEGHSAFIFTSRQPPVVPFRNIVGNLQSSRWHGQISF